MSDGGREMVFDSVPDSFANMKTIFLASLILTVAARAATPDSYRKRWRDPEACGPDDGSVVDG